MKIVYAKYNSKRLSKFQISTIIIKDDELYVLKSPETKEAKNHIKTIYENYFKLLSHCRCDILKPKKLKDSLRFPFLPLKTLHEQLLSYYFDKDMSKFEALIYKYLHFIDTISNIKEVVFVPSDNFIKVFGNVSFEEPIETICMANIDLIFSNIFVQDERFIMTDYEWIFDFEVPKDYIIARALVEFSKHIPINVEAYLPSFKKYKDIFFSMEKHFCSYVFGSNQYLQSRSELMYPYIKQKVVDNNDINLQKQVVSLQEENSKLQEQVKIYQEEINKLQKEIEKIIKQRDEIILDYKALEKVAQSLRLKNRLKNLLKKVFG